MFVTEKNNSGNKIAAGPTSGLIRGSVVSNNLNRSPYDGKIDPYGNLRLRIAIVDNPLIKRDPKKVIDAHDPENVINMTQGTITVKWAEHHGGVVKPSSFGEYGMEGETSSRESISLTYPFIWANDKNWCGINYLPPVGSVLVVGFRKHNQPIVLGYIQPHYQITQPLELGEIMNKGYGNNTSHWKMHDEQEHKAWVTQGSSRPVKWLKDKPGRKYEWGTVPYTVGLKLRLKAWINPFDPGDKKEMIEMYAYRIKDGILEDHSMIEIRPEMIHSWSENPIKKKVRSEQIITPDYLTNKSTKLNSPVHSYTTWTPGNIRMHATGTIKITAGKIYLN